MTAQPAGRLEQIAEADPTIGPLARLQAEAFRASADDGWAEGVPDFTARPAAPGVALLHHRHLLGRLSVPVASLLVLAGGLVLRVVVVLSSEAIHPPPLG